MRRTLMAIIAGCVFAMMAGAAAPAGAAAAGWTYVPSDYARNANTPHFWACRASQTSTTVKLYVLARRPNGVATSIAVIWPRGSAFSNTWITNPYSPYGETQVSFTVPKNTTTVFSWQSASAGHGYATQSLWSFGSCW